MTQQSGQERRMSPRIATQRGMRLYAYGMLVASGVTVDMSEHGMLIRIEEDYSDDELDPGKHLDVMLEYSPAEEWLPIQVVRKWEAGIAACLVGMQAQSGFS
jgi:hypothetical protein